MELRADKLLCLTGGEVRDLALPHYLPLDDAERLIMASVCGSDWTCVLSNIDALAPSPAPGARSNGNGGGGGGNAPSAGGRGEMTLDLDSWQQIGFPAPVLAAVVACKSGVKRAHLVDSEADGALLLELYTRDGEGSGRGTRLQPRRRRAREPLRLRAPRHCSFSPASPPSLTPATIPSAPLAPP